MKNTDEKNKMYFKSEKDREGGGKKLPLFPLVREQREGAAEVHGQSKNRGKKGGERKRKERAGEKKCQG